MMTFREKLILFIIRTVGVFSLLGGVIFVLVDKFYLKQNLKTSIGFTAIVIILVTVVIIKKILTKKNERKQIAKETTKAFGVSVKNQNVVAMRILDYFLTAYPIIVAIILLYVAKSFTGEIINALWLVLIFTSGGYVMFAVGDAMEQGYIKTHELQAIEQARNNQTTDIINRLRSEGVIVQ